ncbi:MAG: hypothetical protein ISQ16_02730 [Candidatus Actinomarina sp.]|jgi:hypothetical protein|nr:hypothetical protein [Candidatus Actinomarina sp.]MBL6762811.1 hypothetical protein [Candidatus Actinomarina sp.]MBL6836237.1 hypothetical protein [Candidatus Actinomarina sp.]
MVDGIEIDKDVAKETLLPDDLNSLAVGSYVVPDPSKRKQYPYVVLGVVLLIYITSLMIDFVSFVPVIIILSIVSLLLFVVNNKFKIRQQEVIEKISNNIDHSIGYYSIALTFQFTLKQILTPVWTVIVYSHENPPSNKTIIEISAFSGRVITEPYTEKLNA